MRQRRVPHSFAYFANEWESVTLRLTPPHRTPPLDLQRPLLKIHSHQARFPVKVGAETAPSPLLRFGNQSAIHGVSVNVAQLLDALMLCPHVEIIETRLPDMAGRVATGHVVRDGETPTLPEGKSATRAGEAVFDDFHHEGRIADVGLGDQQMKMLRHDDVAVNNEAILAAGFLEDFEEQVATEGGAEMRAAVVTTAGDVVQIVVAVETVEALRHGDRG